MKETLPKKEILRGKDKVKKTIEFGKQIASGEIFCYCLKTKEPAKIEIAFSAPKKKFPLATKRNKLKRFMREAYRKNKSELDKASNLNGASYKILFLIEKEINFSAVEQNVKKIIQKIISQQNV